MRWGDCSSEPPLGQPSLVWVTGVALLFNSLLSLIELKGCVRLQCELLGSVLLCCIGLFVWWSTDLWPCLGLTFWACLPPLHQSYLDTGMKLTVFCRESRSAKNLNNTSLLWGVFPGSALCWKWALTFSTEVRLLHVSVLTSQHQLLALCCLWRRCCIFLSSRRLLWMVSVTLSGCFSSLVSFTTMVPFVNQFRNSLHFCFPAVLSFFFTSSEVICFCMNDGSFPYLSSVAAFLSYFKPIGCFLSAWLVFFVFVLKVLLQFCSTK